MAYILTPRFAPAYQAPQCNPFGFCAPTSYPTYSYRTMRRPQPQPQPSPSPFSSFFSQLEDLVGEIDRESQRQAQIEAQREAQRAAQIEAQREAYQAQIEAQRAAFRQRQAQIEAHIEAQREAHRQRQLRKYALRAKFAVTQNEQGWQVDAEVPGFEQENISIEITDENTLKIVGNTEWAAKTQLKARAEIQATPTVEPAAEETTEQTAEEKMEGISLEPQVETDTSSQKSYQPTVEDDFEDLGPEASTLFSTSSQPTTPTEPKGKEKAVEPSVEHRETIEDPEISVPTESVVTKQPHPEAPVQQEDENPRGSFERTFRFPERIDANSVRASLKEGMLSISVPRAQVQQVRRIAIL
ncbi:HSP20-like chaperone [Lizonia empirigonia]|nr:HSP20-like chaperone [Lizonia empirigonia]